MKHVCRFKFEAKNKERVKSDKHANWRKRQGEQTERYAMNQKCRCMARNLKARRFMKRKRRRMNGSRTMKQKCRCMVGSLKARGFMKRKRRSMNRSKTMKQKCRCMVEGSTATKFMKRKRRCIDGSGVMKQKCRCMTRAKTRKEKWKQENPRQVVRTRHTQRWYYRDRAGCEGDLSAGTYQDRHLIQHEVSHVKTLNRAVRAKLLLNSISLGK